MSLTADSVKAWYTKQFHDFYYDSYVAKRGYTSAGEERVSDPEKDVYPEDTELSAAATRIDPDLLSIGAREAYDFYHKNFNEMDIGGVRAYAVPIDAENTYAVRTTTDGDDGYLEIFDADGELLAAGRTNLDVVVWYPRESLRAQVANYGEFTQEMRDAMANSVWGKPLPWDCQAVCWQCEATGGKGYCRCKKGHRQTTYDLHTCNPSNHTWDDTPPDPRIFVKPTFELRLTDGSVVKGPLPDYKITFHTRVGPITALAADLKKIEFARTNGTDASIAIGLAIHKLDGPEQAQAEADLLAQGFRAFAPLVFAAQCGDGPINRRARALAARIQASAPPELLSLRKSHAVTTVDAQFIGDFRADMFDFPFVTPEGYQTFPLSDVVSLIQNPLVTVDVPRPDPGWLGRYCPNWFGAKLSFIVKGALDYDLMGTDVYTMGSQLGKAAVHAGIVKPGEMKVVRVEILLAPPKFVGSERNGVTSIDWEEPETGAFRFIE